MAHLEGEVERDNEGVWLPRGGTRAHVSGLRVGACRLDAREAGPGLQGRVLELGRGRLAKRVFRLGRVGEPLADHDEVGAPRAPVRKVRLRRAARPQHPITAGGTKPCGQKYRHRLGRGHLERCASISVSRAAGRLGPPLPARGDATARRGRAAICQAQRVAFLFL